MRQVEVICVICNKPFMANARGKDTAKVHKGECLAKLRSINASKVNKRLNGATNPSAH